MVQKKSLSHRPFFNRGQVCRVTCVTFVRKQNFENFKKLFKLCELCYLFFFKIWFPKYSMSLLIITKVVWWIYIYWTPVRREIRCHVCYVLVSRVLPVRNLARFQSSQTWDYAQIWRPMRIKDLLHPSLCPERISHPVKSASCHKDQRPYYEEFSSNEFKTCTD